MDRVTRNESAMAEFAEQFFFGAPTTRAEQVAHTPAARNVEPPADFETARVHQCGMSAAASDLIARFHHLTGDILERPEAARLVEGVIGAYVGELQRASLRRVAR